MDNLESAPLFPSEYQLGETQNLRRRLGWLLVFRAAVATTLLVLTIAVDLTDWPLRRISIILYVIGGATYAVVLILGLLLRHGVTPLVLAAVHLAAAVLFAAVVVQATGGIDSTFSFLYLLAILDAAIIDGKRSAIIVATVSSIMYPGQLALQLYGVLGILRPQLRSTFAVTSAATIHVAAFYAMAFLAGHLASLLQRAYQVAVSARTDLMRAEAMHRTILESLPVGVLTYREDRMVLTANAAAADILRSTVRDIVGSPLPAALVDFCKSDQKIGEISVLLGHENRTLAVSRSAVRDTRERSHASSHVLVLEDRTDMRKLERDLRDKERLASIGTLSASIAHEIRNPLAAIAGSLELLQREGSPKTQRRLQDITLQEAERLNVLITGFLEYARPNPPVFKPCDLPTLVRDTLEVARLEQANGAEIVYEGPERLKIQADPQQLRQVIWNLVRNALDVSPTGTSVRVCVDEGKDGTSVALRVLDRGPGVPEEMRNRLFEPFQTTKDKGTGLGLAVVHRIVTEHGAEITYKHEDGVTEVCVDLSIPAGKAA